MLFSLWLYHGDWGEAVGDYDRAVAALRSAHPQPLPVSSVVAAAMPDISVGDRTARAQVGAWFNNNPNVRVIATNDGSELSYQWTGPTT